MRFKIARRRAQDFLPGRHIAGDRDHAHPGVRDQGRADALAASAHDVHRPLGEDLGQKLGQLQGGERRLLRGLQHHGVAGRERRSQLPCRHHQRVIPGRDRGDDSHRIAPDHAGETGQIFARQRAVLRSSGRGEKAKHIGDRGNLVIQRGGERLAGIVGFQFGERGSVGFDAIRQAQQQRRPVLRHGLRPARSRHLGRGDGSLELRVARLVHFGNALAARRVEHALEGSFALHQGAVDQEFGLHRELLNPTPYAFSCPRRRTAACAPLPPP